MKAQRFPDAAHGFHAVQRSLRILYKKIAIVAHGIGKGRKVGIPDRRKAIGQHAIERFFFRSLADSTVRLQPVVYIGGLRNIVSVIVPVTVEEQINDIVVQIDGIVGIVSECSGIDNVFLQQGEDFAVLSDPHKARIFVIQ